MVEPRIATVCASCGGELSLELSSAGLCPGCLIDLALESPALMSELEHPQEAETLAFSETTFAPGTILGKRYRIRSALGRGGMGEVWRAYDLKLRLDVALKAVRIEHGAGDWALETLRREVRSAREVVSSNVCRVYDLEELDGQELVSMEYVDGTTLTETLSTRSPLDLSEAQEIASQFLAGLEAIHAAGLVHRDIKPENVMITRTGRVVVMDFGLAKGLKGNRTRTVSGTPAYMAPEQARGEAPDARGDVFSAAVVLAEMVSPRGVRTRQARQRIWERIRHEPPVVAKTPWASTLTRALSADKERRPATASDLARALEEVTLRAGGEEDVQPYPGLASFTEKDAQYFFGRELEVEEMWKKLQRPHLLALIAPSGAGKSSFLRAGLIKSAPTDWRVILTTPGNRPVAALGRALAPELAGDDEALADLLSFDDSDVAVSLFTRWRKLHGEGLVIVDQFEELFTQNTTDVQEHFADLMRRLALEADIHVLLSMRDDFLFECTKQEGLEPIFSELTPLKPLSGAALRRALVQPALKCGYRFADDSLVDEMVSEVGEERGALPLLAFAASRLWEMRDRKQGLLVREAYEHIGGVAGALAQHAETTLETIGQDRMPMVRDLFRNLVTPQGTRAARDRDELLSIFDGDEREAAGKSLDTLVNARLLTSYEAPAVDDEDSGGTRLEIIHESLLSAWPRLVRWQTRDADSAQMRQQVRQAATVWDERGRSEDLLWTGAAYREFVVWKEEYPGGLTETEQSFAEAVVEFAGRTRRRRRVAVGAAFALLAVGLAVVAGFWKQSEVARQEAVEEALRAEASKIVAIGRNALLEDSTEAVAYALASLELSDQEPARLLALEALWRGPTSFRTPSQQPTDGAFSPDGEWIAHANQSGQVTLVPRGGGRGTAVKLHETGIQEIDFASPDLLVTLAGTGSVSVWQVPDLAPLRSLPGDGYLGFKILPGEDGEPGIVTWEPSSAVRWWSVDTGEPTLLGKVAHQMGHFPSSDLYWDVDPVNRSFVYGHRNRLLREPLSALGANDPELLGIAPLEILGVAVDPNGQMAATYYQNPPGVSLWDLTQPGRQMPLSELDTGLEISGYSLEFSPDGNWLAAAGRAANFYLWDLTGPPDSEPLVLHRRGMGLALSVGFSPDGRWLLTVDMSVGVDLWPLTEKYAPVLEKRGEVWGLGAAPDASWVAASGPQQTRIWPGSRAADLEPRNLVGSDLPTLCMANSPDGSVIAFGSDFGTITAVSPDGNFFKQAKPFEQSAIAVAVDPSGQYIASGAGWDIPDDAHIHIWELATNEVKILDPEHGRFIQWLAYTGDGRLIESGLDGVAVWDVDTAERRKLYDGQAWFGRPGPGDESIVFLEATGHFVGLLRRIDIETGDQLPIADWGVVSGPRVLSAGDLVAATLDGVVLAGRLTEGQPHRLYGHSGFLFNVIETDDSLISGGTGAGQIRMWSKPDLDSTPFHHLPHDELVDKLRALTNVRAVKDEGSETGYTTEVIGFPGWEVVPTW